MGSFPSHTHYEGDSRSNAVIPYTRVCEGNVDHAWGQGGAQPHKVVMHTCKMCSPAHMGTPHYRQAHGYQQFLSCSLRLRIWYCEAARDGAVTAESYSNRRIKQNGKLGKHNHVQKTHSTSAETSSMVRGSHGDVLQREAESSIMASSASTDMNRESFQ